MKRARSGPSPPAKRILIEALDAWGLTPAGLRRLGDRRVDVSVDLAAGTVSSLVRLTPRKRLERVRAALAAQSDDLRRAFPDAGLRRNGEDSYTLEGALPARRLCELAARREVKDLCIHGIEGLRRKEPAPEMRWFCVWGIVAIQVEGVSRGPATVEDRLVLVKAWDEEDAERGLKAEWAAYAAPYLNVRGELVRWKLIEIQGVHRLLDKEIDPRGTEVYSRLRSERMRAMHRWYPGGERGGDAPPQRR